MRKLPGDHPGWLSKMAVKIIKLTMEEAPEAYEANMPFYR